MAGLVAKMHLYLMSECLALMAASSSGACFWLAWTSAEAVAVASTRVGDMDCILDLGLPLPGLWGNEIITSFQISDFFGK